jgi:hypothetical protein
MRSCGRRSYAETVGDASPAERCRASRYTTRNSVANPAMIRSATSLRFVRPVMPPYIAAEESLEAAGLLDQLELVNWSHKSWWNLRSCFRSVEKNGGKGHARAMGTQQCPVEVNRTDPAAQAEKRGSVRPYLCPARSSRCASEVCIHFYTPCFQQPLWYVAPVPVALTPMP